MDRNVIGACAENVSRAIAEKSRRIGEVPGTLFIENPRLYADCLSLGRTRKDSVLGAVEYLFTRPCTCDRWHEFALCALLAESDPSDPVIRRCMVSAIA
jgi:hypothetical protein